MRVKSKNKLIVVLTCLMAFFVAFACFTMLTTSEVKATTNGMTFDEKVQIRTVPNSYGIRFALNIDQETYNTVSLDDDAEIGAIIIPAFVYQNASALEGDLINNILTLYPQNTKDGITAKVDLALLTETDGVYTAGCSLTNVKDVNLKYDYQAVGYYTLDGVNYVYGQASESESMADVAYAYLTSPDFSEEDEGSEGKGILTSYIAKTAAQKVNGSVAGVVIDEETGDASLEVKVEKDLGQSVDLSGLDVAIESSNESIQVENGIITLKGKKAINENLVVALANGAITYNISIVGVPVVEADVKDGLDLSVLLPEGVEIDTAKLGETDKIVSDGKVSFEATETSLDEQVVIVTDVNGVEYKIKVTVWSLLIDNEEELTQMNQYTYTTIIHNSQATIGNFKLMDNIVMENPWKQPYTVGIGDYPQGDNGWHGVFEGNGKSITNFNLALDLSSKNAGMFHALGKNSVIRNLKLEGTNFARFVSLGGHSGLLALNVAGGTIENVELTVNVPDTYTPDTDPLCAGIFGILYATQYNSKLVLNNVKIIAKDDTMATNKAVAPLGGMIYSVTKDMIELTNVVIAGFGNIMYDSNKTAISDLDGLNTIATCTNVSVYATLAEYNESLYIKLDPVETDLAKGIDFASMIDGEIASVTYNGQNVALTNGKQVFTANTEASDVARSYIINDTKGNIYTVNVTVYSAYITSEQELRNAHNYQTIVTDQYGSKVGGYFKLAKDIIMTSEWTANDMFGFGEKTWYSGHYGFVGTIDGNGKTIDGLIISGGQRVAQGNGFIYILSNGGVVKNITFTNAQMNISGGCNGGFIAAHVQGGTIENVKITISFSEGYTEGNPVYYVRAGGVLLGEIGRNGENLPVNINNVTIISANEATSSRNYTSPIGCKRPGDVEVSKDLITLTNVNLVGFNTLMSWNANQLTTVEQVSQYITCNNVKVYATLADYEATLA